MVSLWSRKRSITSRALPTSSTRRSIEALVRSMTSQPSWVRADAVCAACAACAALCATSRVVAAISVAAVATWSVSSR